MHLTKFGWDMMKKDVSANLCQMFDSLQFDSTKYAPQCKFNIFVAMATCWFQNSPILKAFVANFGIPFSYLQMVPHMHDPASM